MKLPFDILGISETKEQVNKNFSRNVNLAGFDFYSQPLCLQLVVLLFMLIQN